MRTRGFSLLEVVVACGIFALIGALMATSLSSSADVKEEVEAQSNRLHQIRQAMSRMVDEISMTYISAHRNAPVLKVKTGMHGERDALHFTAFGYIVRQEDAKRSDQRELSFFLDVDPRTGTQGLVRREQSNPDDDMEDGGRVQTLLPDVTFLEFQYFDGQTGEFKSEWDTTESATLDLLPPRIRIKFTARLEDGSEESFMSDTRLWLTRPWAFRS